MDPPLFSFTVFVVRSVDLNSDDRSNSSTYCTTVTSACNYRYPRWYRRNAYTKTKLKAYWLVVPIIGPFLKLEPSFISVRAFQYSLEMTRILQSKDYRQAVFFATQTFAPAVVKFTQTEKNTRDVRKKMFMLASIHGYTRSSEFQIMWFLEDFASENLKMIRYRLCSVSKQLFLVFGSLVWQTCSFRQVMVQYLRSEHTSTSWLTPSISTPKIGNQALLKCATSQQEISPHVFNFYRGDKSQIKIM